MSSTRRRGRSDVTLARALSKFGCASRSQAQVLVRQGKVTVNRRLVRSPDLWVDLRVDKIAIEGKPLRGRAPMYFALNKPAGVVTTRSDEFGRRTVYDVLPKDAGWLFPIGRLDKETSGLLLFTNDTRFGERVTSPLEKIPKSYKVRLDRPLTENIRARMESPVKLGNGTVLMPSMVHVTSQDATVCTITIYEGKNRQIRRVCEHFGYKVLALKRLSIGHITLGELKEGHVRRLTPKEVSEFRRLNEE